MKPTTTTSKSVYDDQIKISTPEIKSKDWKFEDADAEMHQYASYIKKTSSYNDGINTEKIKFLYSNTSKKVGGKFSIGDVALRSDIEKMIDSTYDFILTVFYPVWKTLDKENKVIQLDRLLCGVSMATEDKPSKKISADTREYTENIKHFGAEKVINSSEAVHLATQSYLEKKKEMDNDEAEYLDPERAKAESEELGF